MIKFYFNPSPNSTKIALMLEELELEYEPVPVDTRKGQQFSDAFLKINPNGKVPAISLDGEIVFDSNAILFYLGERWSRFIVERSDPGRAQLLSWLMFVATGVGPFCGQAVHFSNFGPEGTDYAKQRYLYEAGRHFAVLDGHLEQNQYILGDNYTLVDMDAWAWARAIPIILGDAAWERFPNLRRLVDEIEKRPAAVRAVSLKDRFEFKQDVDEDARRHMFKHLHIAPI